jgi:hypothetical protein
MSSYLTYMTAVSSDLRQIPVWEPGAATALGDYGEIRNKQWQRLGSIWDRLPEVSPGLRDESTAHLELMCRGSSEVCNGGASLSHDGSVGTLGLSIRFSKCVFRAKLDTHSTANWTLIPRQSGRPFQRKLDTDSASNWTV